MNPLSASFKKRISSAGRFTSGVSFLAYLAITIGAYCILAATFPLLEPSEARFATSGLYPLLGKGWFTPHLLKVGTNWEVYWSKPPLHPWLTAVSYLVFGVSEFAARIQSIASLVVIVGCSIACSRTWLVGLGVGIIVLTFGLTIGMGGAVLADTLLSAIIACALTCFFHVVVVRVPKGVRHRRFLGYAFFFLLGLGMLVKGPVAPVLVAVTCGLWSIGTRDFTSMFRLPLVGGITLFFAVWVPQYLIEEYLHPGYLHYFLIEENFKRFVAEPNLKYGTSHTHVRGFIWLALLIGALPWLFITLKRSWWSSHVVRPLRSPLNGRHRELIFFLSWSISCALFFTMARQVIFTYVKPSLAGLALLITPSLYAWGYKMRSTRYLRSLTILEVSLLLVGIIATLVGMLFGSYPTLTYPLCFLCFFSYLLGDLWISRGAHSRRANSRALFRTGTLVALTSIVLLNAGSHQIGLRRSSRAIVTKVIHETSPHESAPRFAVLYAATRSAYFYNAALLGLESVPPPIGIDTRDMRARGIRDAILESQDLPKLIAESVPYREKATLGKWIWIELSD
jgi:4-amino-4-deoxy-L-arabinose transferase-like glycosyltransferase